VHGAAIPCGSCQVSRRAGRIADTGRQAGGYGIETPTRRSNRTVMGINTTTQGSNSDQSHASSTTKRRSCGSANRKESDRSVCKKRRHMRSNRAATLGRQGGHAQAVDRTARKHALLGSYAVVNAGRCRRIGNNGTPTMLFSNVMIAITCWW